MQSTQLLLSIQPGEEKAGGLTGVHAYHCLGWEGAKMQSQALFIVLFNFDFRDKWCRMEAEEFECGEVMFQVVQTAVQLPVILRYASNVVSFSLYPLQIEVMLCIVVTWMLILMWPGGSEAVLRKSAF